MSLTRTHHACVQRWLCAPTDDEAIDAIVSLAQLLPRERYVPGNGIDTPGEWEPIPWDEEPDAWWDEQPEADHE
ncbi:MAG: hypothetical protein JXA74_02805 [Anaerolineae bacterium]|nr:hypothetical protein [Anaerolineae bacterium]